MLSEKQKDLVKDLLERIPEVRVYVQKGQFDAAFEYIKYKIREDEASKTELLLFMCALGEAGIKCDDYYIDNNYFECLSSQNFPNELTLPEGLVEIGNGAFMEAYRLNKIVIPESCKVVGKAAFYNSSLKEVIISSPDTEIYSAAFGGSRRIKKAILPKECNDLQRLRDIGIVEWKPVLTAADIETEITYI